MMKTKCDEMIARHQQEQQTQPIGFPVHDWQPRPLPGHVILNGVCCALEPLSVESHAEALFSAYCSNTNGSDWTYLSVGPFEHLEQYRIYVERIVNDKHAFHYAVIDGVTGMAVGSLALMHQQPEHGVIEVGRVSFTPVLQRSRAATEAHFLLMAYAFDVLGYRRCEWKCDSLNARSRQAAERLGFQFEGIFRQAMIYKGRSRDTAWFSIIDKEWPLIKTALQAWLKNENFDENGQQLQRLQAIREQMNPQG